MVNDYDINPKKYDILRDKICILMSQRKIFIKLYTFNSVPT